MSYKIKTVGSSAKIAKQSDTASGVSANGSNKTVKGNILKISNKSSNSDLQLVQNIKEITLDDGTKVLVEIIQTVNQPKGGKVNVYMAQNGQTYYQYVDENEKQQKITKVWDYFAATEDNLKVAWNKLKEGHPLDALITFIEGAEDPRSLNTGVAPGTGFAKGASFIKSMKDLGKWLKQLKNIKTFEQFKSFAINLAQKIKPAKQMKPRKNLPDAVDLDVYRAIGKRNIIAESFRFGNSAGQRNLKGILKPDTTEKIVSNLSKTLGKKIDSKNLKVVGYGTGNSPFIEYQVTYFDNATGKAYCYLVDGTPNMILEFEYGITGKIKDYRITSGWLNGEWADF